MYVASVTFTEGQPIVGKTRGHVFQTLCAIFVPVNMQELFILHFDVKVN